MREAVMKDVQDEKVIKAEDDFRLKIESTWHIALGRLPIVYGFDYAGSRTQIEAWLELKNRNFESSRFDDSIINLNKWIKGKELRDSTDLPTYLCVRYTDIDLYVRLTDHLPHNIAWGGRTTQTRDWQDIGPVVHIPISEFTEF